MYHYHFRHKNAKNRRNVQHVEVPHDVLLVVHLVGQQGGVLDPKCGTSILHFILDRVHLVQVPGLKNAIWQFFPCEKLLEIGRGQEVPERTRRGKKLIQLHYIPNWAYCDLPWRGICLKTPGRAPGTPLNMGCFHCFIGWVKDTFFWISNLHIKQTMYFGVKLRTFQGFFIPVWFGVGQVQKTEFSSHLKTLKLSVVGGALFNLSWLH